MDSALALAGCEADSTESNKRYRELANGDVIDLEKCLTLPDIFNLLRNTGNTEQGTLNTKQ